MHPPPETFSSMRVPLRRPTTLSPSETKSSGPVAATTRSRSSARAFTALAVPSPPATESTPLIVPADPISEAISPALPLITDTSTSSTILLATSVLRGVAPAPTGSRTTGMPRSLASLPASSMLSMVLRFSVPMLSTTADAAGTMPLTSSISSVITGEPPQQMHALATSFTVT